MTVSFHIVTLGCPKNAVDSEHMSHLLTAAGYASVPLPRDADVVIVNTCGFIESAKRESIDTMLSLGQDKRRGQMLIAAGCLSERYGAELLAEMPELDAALGTLRWADIASVVEHARRGDRCCWTGLPQGDALVARRASGPTAYLKIAEGCSAGCAFCAIPAIKGPLRSTSPEQCAAEARALAEQGVQEIILVAQDTTAYGSDLGMRDGLADLIDRIADAVPSLPWLRLMYAYPEHVTPRLIETMARHHQVVKYLDLPLQHAHPDTLRRMRRAPAGTAELVTELRRAMPDIALRTTFMVGYPGETEEEFRTLLAFMESMAFDWAGVFTYSPEEGTEAAGLPCQIPARVKRQRYNRAMRLQQSVTHSCNQRQEGRELAVLVEGTAEGAASRDPAGGHARVGGRQHGRRVGRDAGRQGGIGAMGRSYREAPEVDGIVFLDRPAPPGRIVRARVASALTYDLMAQVIEDPHAAEPVRTPKERTE